MYSILMDPEFFPAKIHSSISTEIIQQKLTIHPKRCCCHKASDKLTTPMGWPMMHNPRNVDINVSNMIMRALITYDIRQLNSYTILRSFMGEHFCFELYHFARGPYDIFDYDRDILYLPSSSMESTTTRNIANEIIQQDANNADVMCVISSDNAEFDVEIESD